MAKSTGRTVMTVEEQRKKSALKSAKWRAENPEKVKRNRQEAYKKNPEKFRAYTAKYRLAHPEKDKEWRKQNPEKMKGYSAKSKATHAEEIKGRRKIESARYYAKHPEQAKKWRKANPDKAREVSNRSDRKRRARKFSNGHEPYIEAQVLELYGTNCHICKEPIDLTAPRQQGRKNWQYGLHIDHVVPLALGGSDVLENVRPSHGLCNLRKSKRQ